MQIAQNELVEQQKWFSAVDTDRSGTIDAIEVSRVNYFF